MSGQDNSELKRQGNTLLSEGKLHEALACYDKAVQLQPDDPLARVNLGYTLVETGQFERAAAVLRPATQRDPKLLDAWFLLGQALKGATRWTEAEAALRTALAIEAAFPFARRELALVLAQTGRATDALETLAPAMEAFADDASCWHQLGNLQFAVKRFADAAQSYEKAAQLYPGFVEAMSNRAVCLQRLARRDEAIALFREVLQLRPGYRSALYNLGVTLIDVGRCDEALTVCDAGLRAHPQDADIHWNKATAHLLLGQFEQGWPEHEWRWMANVLGQPIVRPSFKCPVWTGAEPVAGRTVLLYPEQGLGDTIQFLRYAPLLAQRGARVLVQLPPALEPLLLDWTSVEIVREGAPLPRLDYYCTFLSLPMAFGTTLASIPADVPYLRADASRMASWQQRLGPRNGVRVGLVWSGNAQHQNDANRSIPLARLMSEAPSDCQWVSLQKELRDSDRAALQAYPRLVHVGEQLQSFADTAALASCMDVVISVDTSMAHLAGAMGLPLWLLLPSRPDWRWMLEREDSPWYPTARLFRAREPRDWAPVIQRVMAELRKGA